MEVSVGFSNTPIDAQTCKMLGLPLGLFVVYVYICVWHCSHAHQMVVTLMIIMVRSVCLSLSKLFQVSDSQGLGPIRIMTGSMWGDNASTVREQYLREKQKAAEAVAGTLCPTTTAPTAVPQPVQAFRSAYTATGTRVSPVVRSAVGSDVVQKQSVLKAATVAQVHLKRLYRDNEISVSCCTL